MGARLAPVHHRRQLLLRIAALHRHRRRDDLPVPEVERRLPALAQHARASRPALALIGFAFFPLMPPRLLDLAAYAFIHHDYGFVDTLAKDPAFWSFNSGAVSKISNQFAAMPSVHCAWALWCACALVPRLKHAVGEGARGALPGHHGHRDRRHRQPLLPRRGRRASSCSASATSPPASSPAPGAVAAQPSRQSSLRATVPTNQKPIANPSARRDRDHEDQRRVDACRRRSRRRTSSVLSEREHQRAPARSIPTTT